MSNGTEKKSIRDQILSAIKSGEVHMRPRWHFILRAALAASGGIILVLALLYLASFVIFALHRTGVWFVPIFGLRGLYVFLISLPWLLVALLLVFIFVLEVLVRHYAFAYRRPLLYSALGIVTLVAVGGFIVAQTPFHNRLFRYAEENGIPLAQPFYREFGEHRFRNVHRGTITATSTDGFIIKNRRGETLTIVITPETRFPFGTDFAEGDGVVVFGERSDDTVQAFGIQKVMDEIYSPPTQ